MIGGSVRSCFIVRLKLIRLPGIGARRVIGLNLLLELCQAQSAEPAKLALRRVILTTILTLTHFHIATRRRTLQTNITLESFGIKAGIRSAQVHGSELLDKHFPPVLLIYSRR